MLSNVRNIAVIAHVDHGKSTLTDALVHKAGLISEKDAGNKRFTDGREDEKERGITIKSTGVSMQYNYEGNEYNVNLVDSPGHVDFSSEVTAALRITDGALVVVDSVESVCVQTETVLRQALAEQIKPVLVINKIDRLFFELKLGEEEIYKKLENIVAQVNNIISTYQSEDEKNSLVLSPEKGNVLFSSAKHLWGFSLMDFAKMYATKLGKNPEKLMELFWGENYYDPENKKWSSSSINENGKQLERGFCAYVMKPLLNLINAIMNQKKDVYLNIFKNLNIKMTEEELSKDAVDVYKCAMRRFLPLANALLYQIVEHLPSPIKAQVYRVKTLYSGPNDDDVANSIKMCNPDGPLMVYVSKMIPVDDGSRFVAFGRVFSGTITSGQKVRIMGANYVYGSNGDEYKNIIIQRVAVMVGGKVVSVDNVVSGNTVAIFGVDQYLLKSGTITNSDVAHPIKTMKFSVSPVVQVSVKPKNPSELPKFKEGLKKLSKTDPCVQCSLNENGDYIVAGVGELHLEICLNDLRDFVKGDIVVSEPVVPYRETITSKSHMVCLAKSPNKHNRLYMTAEPLDEGIIKDIEDGIIKPTDDATKRAKYLAEKYGWDINDAKKIWFFGPMGNQKDCTNVLVDCTKGVQFMNEIKDHVNTAFQNITNNGILTNEPVRGVRFNIIDVNMHADAIHRGAGQITPAARNAMYATMLCANPTVYEPMYLADINVPTNYVGTIYSCLNQKRGKVISEESNPTLPIVNIKGYLPVSESFGFNEFLKSKTAGQAFLQCVFDHWELMSGDLGDANSRLNQVIVKARSQKGMKLELPNINDYNDKL